jgi:hypothetical protein
MTAHEWSIGLYWLNFSLLVAHQIDSAYWEEWKLFRIPGGNQLNLALNLLILLFGVAGFGLLVDDDPLGDFFAAVVAGSGLFAVCIHSFFLLRGDRRFRQPASLGLLAGTGIVSPLQLVFLVA